MSIFGARTDDWRPDRPDVRPFVWIGGIVVAVAFYIAVAAIVGTIINGNGSPFLS